MSTLICQIGYKSRTGISNVVLARPMRRIQFVQKHLYYHTLIWNIHRNVRMLQRRHTQLTPFVVFLHLRLFVVIHLAIYAGNLVAVLTLPGTLPLVGKCTSIFRNVLYGFRWYPSLRQRLPCSHFPRNYCRRSVTVLCRIHRVDFFNKHWAFHDPFQFPWLIASQIAYLSRYLKTKH